MSSNAKFWGVVALVVMVSGYLVYQSGWFGRKIVERFGHAEFCIKGVKYIQFASGATVMYMPDGKIATCTK